MAGVNLTQEQLQQLVQAAVAAALAAQQQQPGAPQAAAPQAPPFAVVPGGAQAQPWDFTSGDGLKLWTNATRPLISDSKWDGEQKHLYHFLDCIKERATSFGLMCILMIANASGQVCNLLTQYGTLTLANVTANADSYRAADAGMDGKRRQCASILAKLIKASISAELDGRLVQHAQQYTVNSAPPGQDAVPEENGALMLFTLIGLVTVETRTTIANITRKLNNLTDLMIKCKSNITDFNTQVSQYILDLEARRATVPDLVPTLFDAYKSVDDGAFRAYIVRKEESYEDGSLNLDYNVLMRTALEKYKTLIEKGQWLKSHQDDLQFIAMVAAATKQVLSQKPAARAARTRAPRNQSTTSSGQGQRAPNRNVGAWAWKGVEPKEGEPHAKTVDGKEYIFCPHHGDTKWVLKVNRQGIEHATGCKARARTPIRGESAPVSMIAEQSSESSDHTTVSEVTPAEQEPPTEDDKYYAAAMAAVLRSKKN